MNMKFEYASGATPLDPDESIGLIPSHITTQGQLNEWEAVNILKAENWLTNSNYEDFLTMDFVQLLHKKMFDDTWNWAGTFRKTLKNIGVEPFNIPTNLKILLDDTAYQVIHNTYPIDEIAYRFHHRLVLTHPFPNGNGRHSRLITDVLLTKAGQSRFTWGKQHLEKESITRTQYIAALQNADKGNYTLLAKFVRS